MPSPLDLVFRMVLENDGAAAALAKAQAAVTQSAAAAAAAATKAAGAQRDAGAAAAAHAQNLARLQVVQGESAKAVQTLSSALVGLDKNSDAALRIQTQLAQIQKTLGAEAAKAQKDIQAAAERAARSSAQQLSLATQQAQAYARLQASTGQYAAGINALQDQLQRVKAGSLEYVRIQTQIEQLQRRMAAQAGQAEKVAAREAKKLADEAGKAARETLKLAEAEARTFATSGNLAAAVKRLEGELGRLTKGTVEYARVQNQIAGLQNRMAGQTAEFAGQLSGIGGRLSIALTAPLVAFGTAATAAALKFDTIQRALTAIAGSSEAAQKQLARLRDVARLPGIDFENAIQGSIRLQAVGFSAQQAERALRNFANAVALTGGGAAELDRVTIQLGQLSAKGKVLAQDLRPIIEAAPAVAKALKTAFGTVDSEEISKQLEKAGKSSRDFVDILLSELERIPRVVGGPREALTDFSTTVQLAFSRIGDAILRLLGPALETIGPLIERLADRFAALPGPVQLGAVAFAGVVALMPPLILLSGQLATAVIQLGVAWRAAQAAFTSGGALATFAAGLTPAAPIILGIAAALGVAALAWASYESAAERAAKVTADALSVQAAQVRQARELQESARRLASAVGDATVQQERALLLYGQLDNETRAYIHAIRDETAAHRELVAVLTQRFEVQQTVLKAQFGDIAAGAQAAEKQIRDLGATIENLGRRGPQPRISSQIFDEQAVERFRAAVLSANRELEAQQDALAAEGEKIAQFIRTQNLSREAFIAQRRAAEQSREEVDALVRAYDFFNARQSEAARQAGRTTGAIEGQANAVNKLAEAVRNLDLSGIQRGVTEKVQEIALQAKSAAEARKLFAEARRSDAALDEAVRKQQQARSNIAAIEAVINPQKAAAASRSITQAREQESRTRIRLLEIELKAVQRHYDEEVDAARRAFESRTDSTVQFIARTIAAEQELLRTKQRIFAAERAEIESDRLPERERLIRLAELQQKELDAIAEHNRRILKLREEVGRQEDKAIREQFAAAIQQYRAHQERLFDIAEVGRKRRDAADRAAAERGDTSFEDAERRATDRERQAFDTREQLLRDELVTVGDNIAEREKLQDRLALLAEERAAFEEEASRRVQAAVDQDVERFERYADARRALQDAIRKSQIEAEEAAIRARSQSRNPVVQDLAQFQRINLERERLQQEHVRRLEEIDARRRAAIEAGVRAGVDRAQAELMARQQANAAIENEEARHNAELLALEEEKRRIVPQPGDIFNTALQDAFASFSQGLGNIIEQLILTGEFSGTAMRQMTAAVLAGLAKQAVVEALFNVAKGLAALANPFTAWQAPGYFAAAKAFGLVAAAAGLAGRAVAGNSFQRAGGRGAAGSASGRESADGGGQQQDRTITLTRGITEGLVGGFREAINPLVRQTSEQNAAIDRLAQAAGVFGEVGRRLQSIRAGELIVMAGEQNPEAFANATARGIERSNSSQRRLTSALNLDR